MKEVRAFNIVECQGTLYDIGRQYGEACKDNILESVEINFLSLCHNLQIGKSEIVGNAMKFFPKAKEFDPDVIDFIKGESEGAGITFEEAFTLRCVLDLTFYYGTITGMCTSFAVTGGATKNGKTILGQNVDWVPGFPMDLLKIKYEDGLEQLVLSFGGVYEYTLNSAGFGISENLNLGPSQEHVVDLPCGLYLPKAMRQKSISDALGVLCQAARGIGYYHLASADGEIVGIESAFDDFSILYPERDMLVHSNHCQTERFYKGNQIYMVAPDSYFRANHLRNIMEQHYGEITPELMMKFLADHENHPNSICRHVDDNKSPHTRSKTLASIVMVPE
ncbi:MAG: Acyl-coenzyme A:6-aminopenicillanic acid acyl-transferase [Pelotomaculum sp. PtaB.Bin013]|uniref:C45 family peptidase n=1 Tax=Pelotomaculum isophthalicicum JI TaxID=947010 RepID=A0A9X4H5L5_9FIRM|nr:C45 family peptidase [Pelotomaculum isophthalicicum]MDF9409753.1 C45 family peptidase [Pelotomaculum isophthalicicum JI]OPX82331.1 MAG: Acyl-coenzyme A:6-aminopenicillanic acid acyl-transferase [Pelotomaculum sp. PtaB.Bin013]